MRFCVDQAHGALAVPVGQFGEICRQSIPSRSWLSLLMKFLTYLVGSTSLWYVPFQGPAAGFPPAAYHSLLVQLMTWCPGRGKREMGVFGSVSPSGGSGALPHPLALYVTGEIIWLRSWLPWH